jgi:hypothetical protein
MLMLQIIFTWLAVGSVLFCVLAAVTPTRDLNRASPEWMAALAFLWPLLLLYALIGGVLALVEMVFRNKRA